MSREFQFSRKGKHVKKHISIPADCLEFTIKCIYGMIIKQKRKMYGESGRGQKGGSK